MERSSASTNWSTYSTPWTTEAGQGLDLKKADKTFGSACCLCFLIGTLGNIVSFLYFKSKKRDISSVIYMLITINDLVISILVLPVGISYLSNRRKGLIFGNKYGCAVWSGAWRVSITLSVFLLLCLSVTRTISLVKPFIRQKVRYLIAAVGMYLVLTQVRIVLLQTSNSFKVIFSFVHSRCGMVPNGALKKSEFLALFVSYNIIYTAPAFVVAISCVISAVELTRRNRMGNVQQRELQQSRNRATVTILLFALLYGVCNIPLVTMYILHTHAWNTDIENWYREWFSFDTRRYYYNTVDLLLLAANSAANPVLYFWRMPRLREYTTKRLIRAVGKVSRGRTFNDHVTQDVTLRF